MSPAPISLTVRAERWPIAGTFTISRGAKTEAVVVVAELTDGHASRPRRMRALCALRRDRRVGRRRDRSDAAARSRRGLDRAGLQQAMPPGAARNALDCAFWDLEAKRAGRPAHELAGLPRRSRSSPPTRSRSATPDAMADAARQGRRPRAAQGEARRRRRSASGSPRCGARRPHAELIVDANEAWTQQNLTDNLAACAAAGVTLIEQPLPDGHDDVLSAFRHPVPICADESAHARASLAALANKYDAVNIKLDKTGGLTEALATAEEAARLGLAVMVGCMVATSLAMAPAMLVAQRARVVDLDGALLLARDRLYPLRYEGSRVHPPSRALWG